MKGKGGLTLTGQLGKVMKESAQTALSGTRAKAELFGIDPSLFETREFHIHVPQGAIPKDGPSAGVTMVTTLVSLLTNTPIRNDVAMTGEITLRGRVLPIGGTRDKILAAVRAGITDIIIPHSNEPDLEEIDASTKAKVNIHLVKEIEQVLELALVDFKCKSPTMRASRISPKKTQVGLA
jgi:ATP-dependent Lon protease